MHRVIVALVAVLAVAGSAWTFAQTLPARPPTPRVIPPDIRPSSSAPASDVGSRGQPIRDTWDWPAAMQAVTAGFRGTQGVVLHIGDSITYANPYGAWARHGKGKTQADRDILQWMHAGEGNDRDGWYLAAADQPGGRSYTAAGGMRLIQALEGNYNGLPSIADLIRKYNPQVVIFMLGTNDASQGRRVADFRSDLEKAVGIILDNHTIPVLSTIPPHVHKRQLGQEYNRAIVAVAREHNLPLIDYCGQILLRQPGMAWDGTLLNKGDVHPSAAVGDVNAASEPTPDNLSKSGYLLRGWLSVQKIKEVKARAIDPAQRAE